MTARSFMSNAMSAWSATSSAPRPSWKSWSATRPSATTATPRPAARRIATSSRSSPTSISAACARAQRQSHQRLTPAQGTGAAGCLFQSTTDTEVINHLIATPRLAVVDRLIDALGRVKGAYSLVALTNESLIGARDPLGVRPAGARRLDGAWILASETCALDIIGARFVRDVEPGEIVIVTATASGHQAVREAGAPLLRLRISTSRGPIRRSRALQRLRRAQAHRHAELAKESPVPADVVVPVPDSGVPAAIGLQPGVGACRSNSASSATTMSAAPSSSRRPYPPSRRASEAQCQPRP
jgi:hypothetical protein